MLYPGCAPFRQVLSIGESGGYGLTAVTYEYDDPYFENVLASFPDGMEADLRAAAEGLALRAEDFSAWGED